MKTHRYKGYEIRPTAYQGSKRWYVQTYHGTTPYDESQCPQATTLDGAKMWIDNASTHTANMAARDAARRANV